MGQTSTSQSTCAPARAWLTTTWQTGTTMTAPASRELHRIRTLLTSPLVLLRSQRAALMASKTSIMWVVRKVKNDFYFPSVSRCSHNSLLPPLLPRGEPDQILHRPQPRSREASTLPQCGATHRNDSEASQQDSGGLLKDFYAIFPFS